MIQTMRNSFSTGQSKEGEEKEQNDKAGFANFGFFGNIVGGSLECGHPRLCT